MSRLKTFRAVTETLLRILRTYSDCDAAIAYAESLSTKFKSEDDESEDEGVEYCELVGTEFVARLMKHIRREGVDILRGTFVNRVAVDVADAY